MAQTNKLTTRLIAAAELEPGRRERLLADGGGLFLLIRPTGRTWMFEYRFGGKKRKMVLGAFPLHSLADARQWRDDQQRLLDNATDPKRERDGRIEATDRTVGNLLDTYRDHLASRASGRQVRNILENHIQSDLRSVPLASVTKADLAAPIRKLADAGKLRTAGVLRSCIKAAFALACDAASRPGVPAAFVPFSMADNPAATLASIAGSGGVTHEQVLTLADLRKYAKSLQEQPKSAARTLLMLSLFCGGQRLAQVARATLEADGKVLATFDRKGRRTTPRRHTLPLIGPASGLQPPGLTEQKAIDNAVDAATTLIEKISGGAYTQRVIRRSVENILLDAGFSTDDNAILMSHGLGTLQHRHYLRGERLDLKTRMLECLHRLLAEQSASNVVTFPEGAAA
jgi:hypothetical protein